MILLAAAVIGTTSCDKKEQEEPALNTEQQQNKIDETAAAFIAELDPQYWQSTVETILPAMRYLVKTDISALADIEPVIEEKTTEGNTEITESTVDLSRIRGHFTAGEDGVIVEEKGDFDDFALSFEAEEHSYVANISVVNSSKRVFLVGMSEVSQAESGETSPSRTWNEYLILPSKVVADVVADGSKPFSLEFGLTYNGPESWPDVLADIASLQMNVSLLAKAGDYAIDLSQLSFKDGIAAERFTIKRSGKSLLVLDADVTGLDVDMDSDEIPARCDNADVALDVMGGVQVKGNLKVGEILKLIPELDKSEPATVEEAQALLNSLDPFYDLDVYYDGGKTSQASVALMAVENGDEIEPAPVINFKDGTSMAVMEFFAPDKFPKTLEAFQLLMGKVTAIAQEIDDALSYKEDAEVVPVEQG